MQGQFKNEDVLPFRYQVTTASLANGAGTTVNLTLATDSWFELHAFLGNTSVDADTDFMPGNFTAQITDQSTGRQLTNAQINQRMLCAPANSGMREARPVLFPPNATLQFDFTNVSGSTAIISMVLAGYKIYKLA